MDDIPEEERLSDEQRVTILDRVKCVLVEDIDGKEKKSKTCNEIMDKYPKGEASIGKRIDEVLKIASKDSGENITYDEYKRAVEQQPEKRMQTIPQKGHR